MICPECNEIELSYEKYYSGDEEWFCKNCKKTINYIPPISPGLRKQPDGDNKRNSPSKDDSDNVAKE